MLSKISKTVLAITLAGGLIGCTQKEAKPVEQPKVEQKVEPKVDLAEVQKQRELNYLNAVSNSTTNSGKVAKEIGALFQKASLHPQLIAHPDWKSDLENEYNKIQADYDSVKRYSDVPEKYNRSHELMLQSYDTFMQSKVKIFEAMKEVNANKLQEGLDLVGKSTELMNQSSAELARVSTQK